MGRSTLAAFAVLLLLGTMAWVPVQATHNPPGPHLFKIQTEDNWAGASPGKDGRVDTIHLFFDQAIDESTFSINKVSVSGREIIGYSVPPGVTEEKEILLRLEETVFDSGIVPTVSLAAGHGITGKTGNPVATTATEVLDMAAPVLVSVRAEAGSDQLQLTFSEGVTAGRALTAADFTYQNVNTGGATALDATSGTHTDGAATMTLKTTPAVAAGDLDNDLLVPQSVIQDAEGNAVLVRATPLQSVKALRAEADIGSDQVRLIFNVPVRASGATAFDINYAGSPSDPIAGVSEAQLQPGGFEILLTLTDLVKSSDVATLDPARVQILKDAVTHADSSAPIPESAIPLIDVVPPQVVAAETNDTDRNGYIDTMHLYWNEPVDAICADGLSVEGYQVDLSAGQLPTGEPEDRKGAEITFRSSVPIVEQVTKDHDTGIVPSFTMAACGNGDVPFRDRAEPANDALLVRTGSVDETDGANPAIITGTTRDQDGDGALDAYEFIFSEDMATSAVDVSKWRVEGHNTTPATWKNSRTLILGFDEVDLATHPGDTGDLPDVIFTGGAIADLAGNLLKAFQNRPFQPIDGAFPVVTQAFGDEGGTRLRLVFSESVEAPTDPVNDPGGPGRGIRESDLAFQNAGGGNSGIVDVVHGKGDRVAFLRTNDPLESIDFGPSGDRVLPLENHIRESNAEPATDRDPLPSKFIHFAEKDVDAPGVVPDGTWVVRAGNATYSFDAVPDDAGDDESGPVQGFHVVVAEEDPGDLSVEDLDDLDLWDTMTLTPGNPAALPGDTQKLTLENLCPGQTYYIAMAGYDEDANVGLPVTLPDPITLKDDTTAPIGELSFLSTTYLLGDGGEPQPTHILNDTVVWSGITDPESCTLHYFWALSEDEGYEVTVADNRTDEPAVNINLPDGQGRPAKLYLHVVPANDNDELGVAGKYPLHLVQPAECSQDNIVAPDLKVINQGGFTRVTWDDIDLDLPEGVELEGYQVWYQRANNKPWQLRADLPVPLEELKFIDDLKVDSAAHYLVTGYFTDGLCHFAVDSDDELVETSDGEAPLDAFNPPATQLLDDASAVPTWAWVTLLSIALVVIGGVALFYGMRRTKLDDSWLEEDEPEDNHDDPFGADPIHDLEGDAFAGEAAGVAGAEAGSGPSMDIACPACSHQFSVTGHRPLEIRCPNCSASGVLE